MFKHGLLVTVLTTLRLLGAESPADQFFQAIQNDDAAALKRSLALGMSPNVKDADGAPALMTAALFAGADTLKLLLDRGADPNAANGAGATALMWAIPDVAKVKLLLAYGADVNARSSNLQRTPLLIAASYPGSTELLQLLLDKGADIHAKDRGGLHALGRATWSGDTAVVRFLAEHGCDPNEKGYKPGIPWYGRHQLASAEYLISKGLRIDKSALLTSTGWVEPGVLEKWIAMGADVNARVPGYKRTPLMTAAASEQATPTILRLLIEKGADPNAEDADGERPLDWAIYRADQSRIDALREHGAMRGHGPRQEAWDPPAQDVIPDARTAISRSIALLLAAAPVVYETRGCISCHHQALPAQAAAIARSKGVVVDEVLAQRNLQHMATATKRDAEAALQGDAPDQSIMLGAAYTLAGLAAERYPMDKATAAFVHYVASTQMQDGSWIGNGLSRPPIEDSAIGMTAIAARALTLYPLAGSRSEFGERLQRAQRWLLASKARTTEDRAMRLVGLVWTKAGRQEVHRGVEQVQGHQKPDGGWSQLDQLSADAYATGLSLVALHEGGVDVTSDAYRKGIAFLLKSQYPDGSWLVRTRSYPTVAYFESGYPFRRNQWISAAGAGWSSLAIAYTLPDAKSAGPVKVPR